MRIAIVDDDIQMCEQLSTLLNEFLGDSSEISDYRSGEEFLTAWETADFDLIILDIFMDKLTGVDVARKIRERDSNVKIVFSTTSNEFASESYEVNACYYLRKPFGHDKVKVMLDRLNLAEIEKMRTVKLPAGSPSTANTTLTQLCGLLFPKLNRFYVPIRIFPARQKVC